jgi:hypothetical protein
MTNEDREDGRFRLLFATLYVLIKVQISALAEKNRFTLDNGKCSVECYKETIKIVTSTD